MTIEYRNLTIIPNLAIHTRVEILLTLCELLGNRFSDRATLCIPVKSAIAHGWEWAEGGSVSRSQLYDDLVGLLEIEPLLTDQNETNALCAIQLSVRYICWHALQTELKNLSDEQIRLVPNDLSDVSEDDISQIIDFAAKSDRAAVRRVDDLIAERRAILMGGGKVTRPI